ncbi:MAG: integrase arm-type DNA-binding domain-containing protein [Flavobacteriaceae bacterium]|nr:integrase arm-type DNA-binding domain-containing protein [Flavobacteriaceae bacterium]
MGNLTDIKIKKLKKKAKQYRNSDGLGLYLTVLPSGTKTWQYRYQEFDKTKKSNYREQVYSIGTYPLVSLNEARTIHAGLRAKVKSGISIQQEKKVDNYKVKKNKVNFESVAEEWFLIWKKNKAHGTVNACRGYLNNIMYPLLKKIDLQKIEYPFVKKYFVKVWNDKSESAKKSAQYLSQIMDYAVDNGIITNNPLTRLNKALPKQDVKHLEAILDPEEYGEFIYSMDSVPNISGYCIRLLIHIAIREGAMLNMKWSNVDWKKKQLEYFDTKRKNDHIVPLSKQAIEILNEVKKFTGNKKYIFASYSKSGHLDPNSLMKQIRQRGYGRDKVTIHGFRSSFMTICEEEEIETNVAITEMAVNHAVKGALGDTYRRGTFLKQRKKLMQDWSDFVDDMKRNYIKESIIKTI